MLDSVNNNIQPSALDFYKQTVDTLTPENQSLN